MALGNSPIVVLSACEVGAATATLDDASALGLPAALLSAGAACVIAPMWPVEDLSIGYVVERLLKHLAYPGYRPAAALFRAIYDLRRLDKNAAVELCMTVLRRMQEDGVDDRHPASYQALGQMMNRIKTGSVEFPFDTPSLWGGLVIHGSGWGGPAGAYVVGTDPLSPLDAMLEFARIEGLIASRAFAEARAALTALLPGTEGTLRARALVALAHVIWNAAGRNDVGEAGAEALRLLDDAFQIASHEQDAALIATLERARAAIHTALPDLAPRPQTIDEKTP